MLKQIKYKNITWIDLCSPTPEDLAEISQKFSLHPVTVAELASPSYRSKIDLYDQFVYFVLHFPNFRQSSEDSQKTSLIEVDFLVGKNFLITTSYEELETLQEFGKVLEANTVMDKNKKDTHAGYLLYYVLKHLYQTFEKNLEGINHQLHKAETDIFNDHEREMVQVLSVLNKKLLDYHRLLKPHQEVLSSLEVAGQEIFGAKFAFYLQDTTNEYRKTLYALENCREFFAELKQTNESLLQIKTAESTKIFSMLAFITFPLTLLATIMSLEAPGTPFVHQSFGFWIILGLMLALAILMMGFYKYKKWL